MLKLLDISFEHFIHNAFLIHQYPAINIKNINVRCISAHICYASGSLEHSIVLCPIWVWKKFVKLKGSVCDIFWVLLSTLALNYIKVK